MGQQDFGEIVYRTSAAIKRPSYSSSSSSSLLAGSANDDRNCKSAYKFRTGHSNIVCRKSASIDIKCCCFGLSFKLI